MKISLSTMWKEATTIRKHSYTFINRVHPKLTKEKAPYLALGAKITDVSRKGDKKVISTLKREKSVLLGKKLLYKKMKPHSIYWVQLSRHLVGQDNCYLDFAYFDNSDIRNSSIIYRDMDSKYIRIFRIGILFFHWILKMVSVS